MRVVVPGFIAEISKFLQAWNTRGSMQLTFDDATAFDYGMEMAKETFDTRGNRKLREIIEEERDAMKSDIWFEKATGCPATATDNRSS